MTDDNDKVIQNRLETSHNIVNLTDNIAQTNYNNTKMIDI